MAFFRWLGSIFAAVLNGFAKLLALVVVVAVVLVVISLLRGDGVPDNSVLTLDLRTALADSSSRPAFPLMARPVTVMDLVFALDAAGRDNRIKGLVMRLGGGGVSLPEAEELTAAFARFRAQKKFIIAQATSFEGAGMGDYLTAAAADQIWMQPKSNFAVAGAGAGEFFLRGFFDKVHAVPQMAKRAEYKSAADMYTEKDMSDPDKEQLNAVMASWYDVALTAIAAERHVAKAQVQAAFEASPQFAEDAQAKGLIDRTGYDDDAQAVGLARAGSGAKAIKMSEYISAGDFTPVAGGANIAVIEAAGEIADGTSRGSLLNTSAGIASDDLSEAIRQATRDNNIKAIVLRVDSPGGSVTASDQILDAVKKAQAKGKPVVVSMGELGASGGYYIAASADRIVAEPATLTGSIGVLTGKVSFGGTADLIGVKMAEVSIGKNTLMDSPVQPFTPDQLAALNHEADVIYADFLNKVSAGRKLPLAQVADVARGRVWTGADAKTHGLVNELGGFWTAASLAGDLGKVPAGQLHFRVYPRPQGILGGISRLFGGAEADMASSLATLSGLSALMNAAPLQGVTRAVQDAPRKGIELRAPELSQLLRN
jgi:protease-4